MWRRLFIGLSLFLAGEITVTAQSRELTISVPIAGLTTKELRDTFDERRGNGPHEAIDILAPRGTPVLAVFRGTIRKLFLSKPGGMTISLFDERENYCYYYAHLDCLS